MNYSLIFVGFIEILITIWALPSAGLFATSPHSPIEAHSGLFAATPNANAENVVRYAAVVLFHPKKNTQFRASVLTHL